ncbi:MAG: hypothetical protein ACKV2T_44080 [Kofleriaceae bacterium]
MSKNQPPKGYKRSWKNLLINKRYQLRFTLFMVGLSTVLMAGLGWWVLRVANETTTVAMASVRGTPCPKIPVITADVEDVPAIPMKLPDPASAPTPTDVGSGSGDGSAAGSADMPDGEEPRRRPTVTLDESSMTMLAPEPKVPPDYGLKVVAHWTCEMRLGGQLNQLERGRMLILYVLIGTGLLLIAGLAIYGIKMTHKVAGPLFKVSLYLAKMRDGRFDKVWNLRKGDQLVDFYEHFKTAHSGVVQMEKDDIAKLRAVVAAAEAAGAGDDPKVVEMREIIARKEKAIE